MMDISDGLSSDLKRLCAASGVGAQIEPSKLPLVRGIDGKFAIELALHGGDDYEILFAVSPRKSGTLPTEFGKLRLTQIGKITAKHGVRVTGKAGKVEPLHAAGWDPFRPER
jgi:thiamine-monophosphate kinase